MDDLIATLDAAGLIERQPCPNCGIRHPNPDSAAYLNWVNGYGTEGYCPECDWTAYDPNCPHRRKEGK